MIEAPKQNIDWTLHHVTGKDLDRESYQNKFDKWDEVEKKGLLNSKNKKEKLAAWKLLNDETIYEYAFFKNDIGEKFKYEAYQDAIAQCQYKVRKDKVDDPNRFIIFRASNQIGKSRFLIGRAKYKALTEDDINIVIVTNNLKLSQFILSELKASLNNSIFADTWKEDVGETDNTTMLTLERKEGKRIIKNRIIIAPAGEGSLGYPIHYLFLDEIDFYENGRRLFWKVYYPRLNKTKGQTMVFSNPNPDINPQESILKELWEGDLFQKKFHFYFLDASWNTMEEFETAKRNSPEYIFSSTHLGEWSLGMGSFFTSKEIEDMLSKDWNNTLPHTDKELYMAVDLGRQRDHSVITIGNPKQPKHEEDKYLDLEVRYIEVIPLRTPYTEVLERMREIKEYYEEQKNPIREMGFDDTGQKTFRDMLDKEGLHATPIDFAAKDTNKTQLYNDFKLMSENRKIKIVYTEETRRQLSGLVFKETENKKYKKVESKTENIHDDICDSIAMLIHMSVTPHRVAASLKFF